MTQEIDREQQFLNQTKDHVMTVAFDQDLYRHLKFRAKDGTSYFWFDVITWPGKLCVTGDCGTYVFSRVQDMFTFFRMPKDLKNYTGWKELSINPSYWFEKCDSECAVDGARKFSESKFEAVVKDYFDDHFEGSDSEKKECWQQIEEEVLGAENEFEAHDAVARFQYGDDFHFQDSWEFDFKDYTGRFIWNLYAIVWAIKKYDEFKKGEQNGNTTDRDHTE